MYAKHKYLSIIYSKIDVFIVSYQSINQSSTKFKIQNDVALSNP